MGGLLKHMIKALLNGILNMAQWVVNLILTPINSLVNALFPDMSGAISNFNNMVNNYIGGSLSWFANLIPPITKSMILLGITFLIAYYGAIWSYTLVIKLYNVIQKVKFW